MILTEWEAWVYLAMAYDPYCARGDYKVLNLLQHPAGLCAAIASIPITASTHKKMFSRLRKYAPRGKHTGDYFWEHLYENKKRSNFCWRMARLLDQEENVCP